MNTIDRAESLEGQVLLATGTTREIGLARTVTRIDENRAEEADLIHAHDRSGPAGVGIVDGGHCAALYVSPNEWTDIAARLGLTDEQCLAAERAHSIDADRRGATAERLADSNALGLPSATGAKRLDAGLSRRQAEVHARRTDGATHETISDELSLASGTVTSHCQRIDEKVRTADRLVDLVRPGET